MPRRNPARRRARASWRATGCAGFVLAAACASADERVAPRGDTDDAPCEALARAGMRARGCDPSLASLAERMSTGEPERCRAAIRRFIGPPQGTNVASIYQPPWPDPAAPLSPAEVRALDEMPLPATLRVVPDLAPAPGRPTTAGRLGNRELSVEADGSMVAHGPPGRFVLVVRHAQLARTHCVDLAACETVSVVAHGAELASHPAVSDGPCDGAADVE